MFANTKLETKVLRLHRIRVLNISLFYTYVFHYVLLLPVNVLQPVIRAHTFACN